MTIVTVVGQHHIGLRALQLFEDGFDLGAFGWKEPVTKFLQDDAAAAGTFQKELRATLGFPVSSSWSGKDHPVDIDRTFPTEKGQDQTAATDFDIVGMRPQAKNLQGRS
ncbi:MAG TPA: hypothetical protein VGF24_34660 [Vicinamibacterales bacterium]